jgi:7-hydroxymethyl chlorophyll a reductase
VGAQSTSRWDGEFDWRKSARPVANGRYPAREHCSKCGLCDSYFVAKVKEACPFLGDGMSRLENMEQRVHGRSSEASQSHQVAESSSEDDELFFGVHDVMLAARVTRPIVGAQWGGLVTTIACQMLVTGAADAVLCVGSDPDDHFSPRPTLARTPEQVLACKGVKPVLASLLELLPLIDGSHVKRLVVCGVGCQIQAFRSIEAYLALDRLFILGTNCVDNAPARKALDKFLHVASQSPQVF